MLPCSLRRIGAAAPHSPILSTIASAFPRGAVTNVSLSCLPTQQRRYSSSKPSRDNDSEDLSVNQSVQTSTVSKTGDAKSAVDKRKRKVKDGPEKQKLPRVPSTQSIPNESLALSSFFSLHRPMSVTTSLPRLVTDDAFAAIFKQRTRMHKSSDVLPTISHTADKLDQPEPKMSVQSETEPLEHANARERKTDPRHSGGSGPAATLQISAMSGQFLPFRPPPLPQPHSATSNADTTATARSETSPAEQEQEQQLHTRVYKAVFTIEETTDAHGEVKIQAHSPELIEETDSGACTEPQSFLGRMAMRQLRHEDSRGQHDGLRDTGMQAISVRRQRKLKMKKKKYKKLLKRLRSERMKRDK